MIHQMVVTKIVDLAIRLGARYGPSLVKAEYNIYRKSGWKPYAARGISHGTAAGSYLGTLIKDGGLDTDNGQIQTSNGRNAPNKQNKTRSRQFSNSGRRKRPKCRPHKYY